MTAFCTNIRGFRMYWSITQMRFAKASALFLERESQASPVSSSTRYYRTTFGIIRQCLLTIIGCTWVAVHPNIPSPLEKKWARYSRQVRYFAFAFIAPEMIIMWAIRQRYNARRLATEYRRHKWTQTHGFFALMGGFMLYDGDTPYATLTLRHLDAYLEQGKLDITKEQINDKSKRDLVGKALVIIQMAWFILQCSARYFYRMPITSLELVTLAFAVLNIATFFFWWNKPQNVNCPWPVPIDPELDHSATETNEPDPTLVWDTAKDMLSLIQMNLPTSGMMGVVAKAAQWTIGMTGGHMFDAVLQIMGPQHIENEAKSVPMFYGGALPMVKTVHISIMAGSIAVVFAGIHLPGCFFHFPSDQEQLLWVLSAGCMTLVPLFMLLYRSTALLPSRQGKKPTGRESHYAAILQTVFATLYVFSRLGMMVLAVLEFRALPPGAHEAVHWLL